MFYKGHGLIWDLVFPPHIEERLKKPGRRDRNPGDKEKFCVKAK